jgi:Flp pilus assembly protein TadB
LMVWKPRSAQGRRNRLDELQAYKWSVEADTPPPATQADGRLATVALSLVNRLIRSGGSRSRIAADLERAGLRIRPQEWILLRICTGAALIAGITVLTRSLPVGVVLGSLLGWLGTRLFLTVKAGRRCSAFADQLPDVLQMIASSLRSGFSLPQALDGVVREGAQPAASEFARALTESKLGLDLEDALDHTAERMKCPDLAWVVMAVRISRDVGGNLAEVLLTTVHTMRERAQLKRQIRALSAEGRLSAYVLVALPISVAGWFTLVRPEYLRPLYTVPAGMVMLVIAVGGVVVGSWWMSRIVKVEV